MIIWNHIKRLEESHDQCLQITDLPFTRAPSFGPKSRGKDTEIKLATFSSFSLCFLDSGGHQRMIVRTVGPGGQTVPGPGQPQGQRVVMTTQGQQIIRTGKHKHLACFSDKCRLKYAQRRGFLSTWKIPVRIPQMMFHEMLPFNCVDFDSVNFTNCTVFNPSI